MVCHVILPARSHFSCSIIAILIHRAIKNRALSNSHWMLPLWAILLGAFIVMFSGPCDADDANICIVIVGVFMFNMEYALYYFFYNL